MSSNLLSNSGIFVPTTNIYEIEQLQQQGLDKELIRNILVHLYQDMSNIALALNLKDSGYYTLDEFLTGQVLFPNPNTNNVIFDGRPIFRKGVYFGSLPDTSTTSIAHNIDFGYTTSFVKIYGTATSPSTLTSIPLPYISTTSIADNIQLSVNSTNVTITTGADQSAYTETYVILEYVKE